MLHAVLLEARNANRMGKRSTFVIRIIGLKNGVDGKISEWCVI